MHPGGAGIAPFKGFIEEREEQMTRYPAAKFGPFELYYGNRDPTEYAYEALLKRVCCCSVNTAAAHACRHSTRGC